MSKASRALVIRKCDRDLGEPEDGRQADRQQSPSSPGVCRWQGLAGVYSWAGPVAIATQNGRHSRMWRNGICDT